MLLQAPTYFKLKETKPGTVLVERGVLKKEDTSERYGNRQFYFYDMKDKKLKCLSGGSLNYILDMNNITPGCGAELKITYAGTEKVENGKFAGNEAHQFEVEHLNAPEELALVDPTPVSSEETKPASLDSLE